MSEFIEIPATKMSLAKRKLVCGIGINDASYMVQPIISGRQEICPYYKVWLSMVMRCYNPKVQAKQPTYIGCVVSNKWLTFSVFRAWMKTQDWKGKAIDKDILVAGNKTYSPANCIFISQQINGLLNDSASSRGACPQGVNFHKASGKYRAQCRVNGKLNDLGYFNTTPEAEYTYLKFKSNLIKKVAFGKEAANNPKLQAALLVHANLFKQKADSHAANTTTVERLAHAFGVTPAEFIDKCTVEGVEL